MFNNVDKIQKVVDKRIIVSGSRECTHKLAKMKNLFKISTSLNFCLTFICVAHIVAVIHSALNPKLPNVEITEKNLSDITFPLREDFISTHATLQYNQFLNLLISKFNLATYIDVFI